MDKLFIKQALITLILIAMNIAAYIYVALGSGSFSDFSPRILYEYGGLRGGEVDFMRVFSSMFMHGGFWHILCNMYALYALGLMCEILLGRFFYALSYVACGVLSGIAVIYFSSDHAITIGASGAVFGLVGMLLVYGICTKNKPLVRVMLPATIAELVFNVVALTSNMNLSVVGHAGGFIGGCIIGFILYIRQDKKTNDERIIQSLKHPMTSLAVAFVLVVGALTGWFMVNSVKEYKVIDEYYSFITDIFDEQNSLNELFGDITGVEIMYDSDFNRAIKEVIIPDTDKNIAELKAKKLSNEKFNELNENIISSLELYLAAYEELLLAYDTKIYTHIDNFFNYMDKCDDKIDIVNEKVSEVF
jgi:membrane associated rhomboid family serine protease